MKQYALEQIRNVALAGHGGSGKTTLAEHLLYIAGHIDRVGSIEAGNTTSDFDPEEQRRKISLSATLLPIEWEGHKINLIDTPGFPDFIGELYSVAPVVDSVILVAPAQAELEVGFENAWELCEARKLPRLIFVNKMERDGADYNGLLQTLRNAYGNRIVPCKSPSARRRSSRAWSMCCTRRRMWAKTAILPPRLCPPSCKARSSAPARC